MIQNISVSPLTLVHSELFQLIKYKKTMARPTTKVDLITSANGQFEKMWKLIDSMSEELQTATFAEKNGCNGQRSTLEQGQKSARCTCSSV